MAKTMVLTYLHLGSWNSHYLDGGLSLSGNMVSTPLKNMSQIGSSPQLLGEMQFMFRTTNQYNMDIYSMAISGS